MENSEVYYDSDGWHGCPCDACKKKQKVENISIIKIAEKETAEILIEK